MNTTANHTVLQIPLSARLHKDATIAVQDMGFPSLQEFVQAMLTKLKTQPMDFVVADTKSTISTKAINRYKKMVKESKIDSDSLPTFDNVNDLMTHLRS